MYKKIKDAYMKHLDNIVLKYAAIYGFDMGPDGKTSHNNEGDAFKHCFMSAEFTLWFCASISRYIGIKHEDNNPHNPEKERKMDLWNNEQGIEIGKRIKKTYILWFLEIDKVYDRIAEEIMKKMNNGKLITSLNNYRLD